MNITLEKYIIDCISKKHYCEFKIYCLIFHDGSIPFVGNTISEYVPASERENVNPEIYGTVKWDGCIDYAFTDNMNNCFLHACSLENIQSRNNAIEQAYLGCMRLLKEFNEL